jgi:hypothetical protein
MDDNHRDQQGLVEATEVRSVKVRYGAPDGPRQKRKEKYDGRDPLPYLGHEAVAQFIASPKSHREFKSLTALAKRLNVARMTVHRWRRDIDVLRRAEWLSLRNKMAGDLVPRREWVRIMEKAVEIAKSGDVQAMKFCEARAWPEDRQRESSNVESSLSNLSLGELAALPCFERAPTWAVELEARQAKEREAAEKGDPLSEHQGLPE